MSKVEVTRSLTLANPLFKKDKDKPLAIKVKIRKPVKRRDGRLDYSDYSELLRSIDNRKPVDERTLLTKAVANDLKTYILRGLNEDQACDLAGISPSTYSQWLVRYPQFKEFIRRVKAQAEFEALEYIQDAAKGGIWSAAAWYLERKYPQRYGRRDVLKQEIFMVHRKFINVVLKIINEESPELRAKIINQLKAEKIDIES